MLDKNWLSIYAPIVIADSKKGLWRVLGAGVFIYDDPFIWYVTANHIIKDASTSDSHVLVNHVKKKTALVDVSALHQQHKFGWLVDEKNDLAATLFPSDPDFNIKAISFSLFIEASELIPSMVCYSIGFPYGLAGFNIENNVPLILDGIVSGIDIEQKKIYVSTPTFPGNSGGPLLVCKSPIQANGGCNLGDQVVFLGGIISEYLLIGDHLQHNNEQHLLPPLHLGAVITSDLIKDLLASSKADTIKKKFKEHPKN